MMINKCVLKKQLWCLGGRSGAASWSKWKLPSEGAYHHSIGYEISVLGSVSCSAFWITWGLSYTGAVTIYDSKPFQIQTLKNIGYIDSFHLKVA